MSVYYEIRERLVCNPESRECFEVNEIKRRMQYQLSQLFARQLCISDGVACVNSLNLRLELDGQAVTYAAGRDGMIPLEVQAALSSLADAGSVDLDMSYHFIWHYGDDYMEDGPLGLTDYLDECPDAVFDCLSYALHNDADCSSDSAAGILSVYGKQEGVLHRGIVNAEEISELPPIGEWRALKTALLIEKAGIKDGKETRVREICASLMALSVYDDFRLDQGMLTFNLNNLRLKGQDQLRTYVSLAQELLSLLEPDTDDYLTPFFMKASLLDDSDNGPNILNIDLGLDGQLAISASYMKLDMFPAGS